MTFKEFKIQNADILLEEPSWDELAAIANGAALFYVSLSGGSLPKDEQKVLWAGYVLTAGMQPNGRELMLLRTTAYGNPKIDSTTELLIAKDGRAALFKAMPVPATDSRNLATWSQWS